MKPRRPQTCPWTKCRRLCRDGSHYMSGPAMRARNRREARTRRMQSVVTEPAAVEPQKMLSLIEAAIMTGLEPGDIRWLERHGKFPRALRLPGRKDRIVLTFLCNEVAA